MNPKTKKLMIGFVIADFVIVAVILWFIFGRNPSQVSAPGPSMRPLPEPAAPSQSAKAVPAKKGDMAKAAPPKDADVPEMKYLPEKVALADRKPSAVLDPPKMAEGTQRLQNIRALLPKETKQPFTNPKYSPDGLQILLCGPNYRGVYLVSAQGGDPVKISDENGFRAEWTSDGKIKVTGEDGEVHLYNPDGSSAGTEAANASQQKIYAEDDSIYLRSEPGSPGVPLTAQEDKFFNPVLSPDGKYVVYQGLVTGLYLAPVDGSEAPRNIGAGNHATWMPDSSGLLYDISTDDGHNLITGDIYYVNRGLTERTKLTNDNGIAQMPSPGPDGKTVVFEVDGKIYVGEVR